jgi:hypothetical protein
MQKGVFGQKLIIVKSIVVHLFAPHNFPRRAQPVPGFRCLLN